MHILGPALVSLSALAWGVIHSLLAALGFKRWVYRLFGPNTERFYRLGYNLFAVISLLPVFALLALFPGRVLYTVSFPWLILTTFGQVVAVLIVLKGISQTGAASFLGLTQLLGNQEKGVPLVTSGIYSYLRHPLYVGGLLFIWLSPVMTTSLLALNIVFTLYIFAGATLEERKLAAEFGETYRQYQRKTPMIIPIKTK